MVFKIYWLVWNHPVIQNLIFIALRLSILLSFLLDAPCIKMSLLY